MPYSDSAPVVGQLDLIGVWLHDPEDPVGTIQNYPYGSASRERSVDAMGAGTYYAGRTSPVVDYPEHEEEAVAFSVQIPHGATWRADVERARALASAKRTMLFRDNRGRLIPGVLSGYRETDQAWGTAVSFTVTRVDVQVPTVGIS